MTKTNVDVVIHPGRMWVAATAIDLVGLEHTVVGNWMDPVTLRNIPHSDDEAAIALFKEMDAQRTGNAWEERAYRIEETAR